jgi:hypothetical protein
MVICVWVKGVASFSRLRDEEEKKNNHFENISLVEFYYLCEEEVGYDCGRVDTPFLGKPKTVFNISSNTTGFSKIEIIE